MATFSNQATLTYNNNITNSNVVSGELLEVLSATKTAARRSYRANDTVTFIINIVNSGSNAITDLTITDNLGAYTFGAAELVPLTYVNDTLLYYVNGAAGIGATAVAGPPLTITGVNVPANGNVSLIYQASVNQFAPLTAGSTITNTATISGASSEITTSSTITASDGALLSITKSVCPESVVENGQLTYTFVIQNMGNTPAVTADNVVVTDIFNPVLNPITVLFNNVTWSSPTNYTYNTTTGSFQTVSGQITVPAATYTQDSVTGQITTTPGISVLKVTGIV